MPASCPSSPSIISKAMRCRRGWSRDVPYPYLLLLVSGGHCQLLVVEGVGRYRRLGSTIDDAAGECFDKGAKLLGLSYPGGPAVARSGAGGQSASRFPLPRPMLGRAGCDFSFSGLKTALSQTVARLESGGQARRARPIRSRRRAAKRHQRLPARPRRQCAGSLPREASPGAASGRGRWRRGQCGFARPARKIGRATRLRARPAAARTLHRQRGDDRLGRDRTAQGGPGRWARFRAAPALAARSGFRCHFGVIAPSLARVRGGG